MKGVKKSITQCFLAKDIDGENYECVKRLHNESIEYDNSRAVIRKQSDNDITIFRYDNGKLVTQSQIWPSAGISHCDIEYDADENKKPYSCIAWNEGFPRKITFDVEYNEAGQRVEKYIDEEGDYSLTSAYEDGKLVIESCQTGGRLSSTHLYYDDKDRIIVEEVRLSQIESYLETKIVITQYFYDESDNIIQEKKAVGTLDEKFFNEEISKDEFYTGEYTIKEFIREDDKLLKTILYNCEVDEVDDFLYKDEFKKSSIIEVTEYVREEEEHETTPYMEDKNGPFILKIEQEIANDFLQSKLIEIYDKTSEMLLKSIKISGYNSTEYEDGIVKVEETIYEYYS